MGDVENSAGQTQATGFNSAYIASLPGILKIVEAILLLITFSCGIHCCTGFFIYVSIAALVVVVIIFIFYAFNLVPKCPGVNWKKTILIDSIVFAVLLLISMSLIANKVRTVLAYYGGQARLASSVYISLVCGYLAMVVFIIDAVIHYSLIKAE